MYFKTWLWKILKFETNDFSNKNVKHVVILSFSILKYTTRTRKNYDYFFWNCDIKSKYAEPYSKYILLKYNQFF